MLNETHLASPRYKISDFFSSLLEPPSSYFITWLSREQSGFRWPLKILIEEFIIEILPNDSMLVRGGVCANSVDELTRDNNGMRSNREVFSTSLPYPRRPLPSFPLP